MARFNLDDIPTGHKQPREDPDEELLNLDSDEEEEYVEANPVIEAQIKAAEDDALKQGEVIQLPRKVQTLKEMPEHLRFQEVHPAYEMIDDIIHKRYGGRDAAGHSNQTRKNGRMPASVYVRSIAPNGRHVDKQIIDDLQGPQAKPLKVTKHDDTQYPSVSVYIQREGLPTIEARIFGSNLIQDEERKPTGVQEQQLPPAFEFNLGAEVNRNYIEAGTAIEKLAQQNQLHQTILRVKGDGRGVVWTGISEAHIEALSNKKNSTNSLLWWEEVVWHLHHCHEIAIHNLPARGKGKKAQIPEDLQGFQKYFSALMENARKHGDFWFYSLANPDAALKDRKFHFQGVGQQPPRWLVQNWWPVKDEEGNVTQVIPLKWNEFSLPTVWSSPEVAAIAWRLNIGRCRETKTLSMAQALKKQAGNLIADFWEHEPGSFRVDIWANFTGNTMNVDDMRPEPLTECTLKVLGEDGKFSKNQYRGIVVPDLWETDSTFTVYVKGKVDASLQTHRQYISLDLNTSALATDRQETSMNLLLKLLQTPDRRGPDVGRWALGCAPQNGITNVWLKEVSEDQKQSMVEICTSLNLDKEQMDFIQDFISCESGVTTLIGPPGTGKSQALIALIMAFNETNKIFRPADNHLKILVVAPSNKAVDQLALRLIESDPSVAADCVRFIGSQLDETKPQKAEGDMEVDSVDEDSDRAMNNASYSMAERWMGDRKLDSKLASYHVDSKFHEFVKKLHGEPPSNDIEKVARNWLKAYRDLKSEDAETRKKARESKKGCETILHPMFWDTVKIVFTTLSSASHDTLCAFFKATLIIIDEAGMAQIPDMMTAIVPNLHSLEHMIISGDPRQQRPMRIAVGQNEFGKMQEVSLLEQIAMGKLEQDGLSHTMLVRQYRTIPEIADMVSHLTYNDKIVNDESVKAPKPVVDTARRFFKGLGPQDQDWDCFGVAVSGTQVHSEKYLQTTSQVNRFEADLIVRTVQGLINQEPAPGKPRIELKDILLLSPYQGQINYLKFELTRKGYMKDPKNRPMVDSVGTIQGSEANIVLLSFCTNRGDDRTKVKFISDPRLINVAISRARSMLVMFGNFLPWVQALSIHGGHFHMQGMTALGNLVNYIFPRIAGERARKMVSLADYTALVNKEAVKQDAQFSRLVNLAPSMHRGEKRSADYAFGQSMANR